VVPDAYYPDQCKVIASPIERRLTDAQDGLSLKYHGDHRTGDSIFRIQVDASEVTGVLYVLVAISRNVVECVFLLALVMLLSPWPGLVAIGGVFPALVLASEQNALENPDRTTGMASLLPNGRLRVIPGTSGYVQHSAPERCVQAWREFVGSL